MDPPVWGTRCHELHQGTWHGRWRVSVGGDWAEQTLQLARLRNGRPICPLHGCRQRTWPLWTGKKVDDREDNYHHMIRSGWATFQPGNAGVLPLKTDGQHMLSSSKYIQF